MKQSFHSTQIVNLITLISREYAVACSTLPVRYLSGNTASLVDLRLRCGEASELVECIRECRSEEEEVCAGDNGGCDVINGGSDVINGGSDVINGGSDVFKG